MERNSLYVTTFGDFSIAVSDVRTGDTMSVSFSNRSKKLLPLIQYLIINRDHPTSVCKLCEIFWPGESAETSTNALKILVHRARTELNKLSVYTGKDLILNRQGAYQWNNDIPIELDCEIFDRLYLEFLRKIGEAQLPAITEAIALYKGRFLPASMAYEWVIPLYENFHLRYIELCIKGAAILESAKQYDELVTFLEPIIASRTIVETLHIQYIRALSRTGNMEKSLLHYRKTSEFFYMQYGKAPSKQFMSLYKEISADICAFEEDINIVLQSLPKPTAQPGAMFCNLNVFREIGQLKVRESLDFGIVSQMALITVSNSNGAQPSRRVMDIVPKIIAGNLRLSDIYTQFSMRQYLILLPDTSREDGLKIIQDVARKIKSALRGSDVVLNHSLTQLDSSVVIPLSGQEHQLP